MSVLACVFTCNLCDIVCKCVSVCLPIASSPFLIKYSIPQLYLATEIKPDSSAPSPSNTHTCKCEKTITTWKTKNGGRGNFGESSRSYNRQTSWKSVSSFKCRRESKRRVKMEQMYAVVMWSLWRLCTPPSYPLSHSSSSSSSPLRCVKWCNVATTGCHMGGLVKLLLVLQSPEFGHFRPYVVCVRVCVWLLCNYGLYFVWRELIRQMA